MQKGLGCAAHLAIDKNARLPLIPAIAAAHPHELAGALAVAHAPPWSLLQGHASKGHEQSCKDTSC